MRTYTLFCLFAVLLFGCAHDPATPGISDDSIINGGLQTTVGLENSFQDPHKLWAAGNLYIDADHDKVELVPFRFGGIHLNVLKFFETSCDECVLITGASSNGDGTYNLSIRITHPFPNHKELTVFDPKLILMFQGSHVIPDNMNYMPLYPQDYILSFRLMGDPEILNPDGFTYRWSPWYDSGYPNPIFNYWEGKYAFGGTPTANMNGYLDYYSNEDRHMLESGASVEKTFLLSLPAGPIMAGYALDVCWEPPTVMPVLNPADDFPITANQPELFKFQVIYNDGNPITDWYCCNMVNGTIHEGRVELDLWYQLPDAWNVRMVGAWSEYFDYCKGDSLTADCDSPDPEHIRCVCGGLLCGPPNGVYQILAYELHDDYGPLKPLSYPSFDIVEVELACE
ncbi:MAG: hypothetical protein NTY09_13495 [bacterium]|nr:hypothetical protein [bacterium]